MMPPEQPPEPRLHGNEIAPIRRDSPLPVVVFAALAAILCGVTLWRTWGVLPWIIGAALFGIALIALARRVRRRAWTIAAAVVAVMAIGLPFALPFLGQRIPVAWSAPDEHVVTSSEDTVVTIGPGAEDEQAMLRARTATTGDVLWSRESPAIGNNADDRYGWMHEAADVFIMRAEVDAADAWEFQAFDLGTGEELWTAPADSSGLGPISASGDVVQIEVGRKLIGHDARSGEIIWSEGADLGEPVRHRPAGDVRPEGQLPEVSHVGVRVPVPEDEEGGERTLRVLEAGTGDVEGEMEVPDGTVAAVVDDVLVLDDSKTADQGSRRIEGSDDERITLRGHALPALDEAWSTEIARTHRYDVLDVGMDPFGTGQTYAITFEGELELISLADGTRTSVPAPPGREFGVTYRGDEMNWTGVGRALMLDASVEEMPDAEVFPGILVDLEAGTASAVELPDDLPAGTLPGEDAHSPAPLWMLDEEDLFGRAVTRALVVEGDESFRDLGALPGAGVLPGHGGLGEGRAGMLFVREHSGDTLLAIDPQDLR